MNIDYTSPEACEARTRRIEAAREREKTRLAQLCEARELIRRNEIRTPAELMTALCNIVAAMKCSSTDMGKYRQQLIDLGTDIEDDYWEGRDTAPKSIASVVREQAVGV
jgi:hypothetical protein